PWIAAHGTRPAPLVVLPNDTNRAATHHFLPGSVAIVGGPSHGTVSVDPSTGQITYTASAGFTGTDGFHYPVSDDHGATSNSATVFVRINRPTAADDAAQTQNSTPVLIDVLANDTDPDGNPHLLPGSVSIVTGPS